MADGTTPEPTAARPHHVRRRARMSRMILIVGTVTAAMHVPVALGVTALAMRASLPHPWLEGLVWALLGMALFAGRVRAGMPDRPRPLPVVLFVDVPYFIHWCAAVWTLLVSVPATVVLPVVDLVRGVPVHVPLDAYAVAYVTGLALAAYGVLVRRRWFRVVDRDVRVTGLPRELDGLRIAHLSDLHVGTLTPRSWGLRWARAANAASPDIAVVTGDVATSGNAYDEAIADVLGALQAPLGVFASMGNHDYFGDEEALVARIASRGVKILRNEGVTLDKGGGKLWLAAIDDTWTRRDDLTSALSGRPEGVPTVLLAHDPNRFDQAAAAGVELVLSGHTHGGQVAVPFLTRALNLARLGYRYTIGIYETGRSTLYVHPGLGTTGPPIRLGAAPEVTMLVLRPR